MEANNTPTYTADDKAAVKILRNLYMMQAEGASDTILFNARMYLQDRPRYERLFKNDRYRSQAETWDAMTEAAR